MTAVARVAITCGAALVMVTAALAALHTSEDTALTFTTGAPPAQVPGPADVPSAFELDLVELPGPWTTR